MPTMLIRSGKREENHHRHRLTLWWVRALASAENIMYTAQRMNRKTVLSTALGILMINARSWETFMISTLKVSLLRTAVIIPYQLKKLTGGKKITPLLTIWWMKCLTWKTKKRFCKGSTRIFGLWLWWEWSISGWKYESWIYHRKIEWLKRAF